MRHPNLFFHKKKKRKEEQTTMVEQTSAPKTKSTVKQVIALASFIAGVLSDLSFEQIQILLKNKNTILKRKLVEVFEVVMNPYTEIRSEWERFYKDHFGLVADLSEVVIPPMPNAGSWRLVFILQGLTLNATLAVMRKKFKVWVYNEDLDASVTVNTRVSFTSYAVWVREDVEPDAEYLGKSTRDADMEGKIGMTLLERLVLELKYFVETGNHLDPKGVTLCTGSRSSDGFVPDVYWDSDTSKVNVDWYGLDNSSATNGLRQAVS